MNLSSSLTTAIKAVSDAAGTADVLVLAATAPAGTVLKVPPGLEPRWASVTEGVEVGDARDNVGDGKFIIMRSEQSKNKFATFSTVYVPSVSSLTSWRNNSAARTT